MEELREFRKLGMTPEEVRQLQRLGVMVVIRCRECRFLGIKDFIYGYCKRTGCETTPYEFCSKGEKRI